jgi:curli biogenesis system outer membrane secretion channel CsgG
LLGGVLNRADIALDISIVDSISSRVLATARVQGQASDISGGLWGSSMTNLPLGGSLSIYTHTPMEKAIRICIIEAVNYISKNIPITYYKY